MRVVNILQVKDLGQGGQSGDQAVSTVPISEKRAKELSRVLQIRIKAFCDKWSTGHDFEHRVINQDTDTSTHLADFSIKEKDVDGCINLSVHGFYNPERDKYGLRVEVEPEGKYIHDSSRRIHGDILLKEFLDGLYNMIKANYLEVCKQGADTPWDFSKEKLKETELMEVDYTLIPHIDSWNVDKSTFNTQSAFINLETDTLEITSKITPFLPPSSDFGKSPEKDAGYLKAVAALFKQGS